MTTSQRFEALTNQVAQLKDTASLLARDIGDLAKIAASHERRLARRERSRLETPGDEQRRYTQDLLDRIRRKTDLA
jgi:hypothetical protein